MMQIQLELLISNLVDKDLKGTISVSERNQLKIYPDLWHSNLLSMKKRTEMQFTSSKARRFEIHRDHLTGVITDQEFADRVSAECKWRVNAARFLQQVENKLQEVKYA